MSKPITVVMPVYDGVTQLDFTGPHQFLSRTPDLNIQVASLGGQPITADNLTFANLQDLAAIESCDVLLVPGGGGCRRSVSLLPVRPLSDADSIDSILLGFGQASKRREVFGLHGATEGNPRKSEKRFKINIIKAALRMIMYLNVGCMTTR
ncbi:hypothetical protein [Rhizobium jaguaris]|uniref:hypothetical protein n=1 Tax=Rhizobium jaguaris TaxID=1312183 RepID=UPI0019693CE1|nr:hypothetical protein [Rhizobium jaguaris]